MRTIAASAAALLLLASAASAQTPGSAQHGAPARKPVPAPALFHATPMPYGSKQSAALAKQPANAAPATAATSRSQANPLAAIPPSRPRRSCC